MLNATPVASGDPLFETDLNTELTITDPALGVLANDFDAEGDSLLHAGVLTFAQDINDGMQLVYRSDASGRAIIQVDTFLTAGTAIPNSITASLVFDGVSRGSVEYTSMSGLSAGDPIRFAMQTDEFDTGMYDWTMTVELDYGSSRTTQTYQGQQAHFGFLLRGS